MAAYAFRPSLRRAALLGVILVGILAASLAAGPAASAQTPDRTVVATPAVPATWAGDVASGTNTTFDPTQCSKNPPTYCDITLVNVVPGDFYATSGGGVEFSTIGTPGNDLDLFVFESDASGTLGDFVGASAGFTADERVSVVNAQGYYLVVAFYFAMTNSGYDGRAEFFRRKLVPSDVDDPRGIQDRLASDPALGYRSHSEPHLGQSPTNPRLLVGASKEYNRDPDSLAEYDFKVGTQASFDRGRTWTDLGQLNVCPQSEAPPGTYPLGNTCYPEDDPNREGTEPEDADDPRPGGDFGEDYLTSDPWVDFDDEGNAYAMVLDAPAGLANANGWGMSFHRWKTPSKRDIRRGRTWSNRIIINAYETPEEQASTLDDKNTFAVNNAGRDDDGKTGIIVACWGQNYDLVQSARQRIVCERSIDGGRSWPDDPTVLSPPIDPDPGFGPFVIGVHVVADTRDPKTFYAVWLDTLTGALEGADTAPLWFTRTTDGAKTWEPARRILDILPIPNIFPRQSFRNLSLPIMAVGPRRELYLTYADDNAAPLPAFDEDGMQADIKLSASYDRGRTWSVPATVNQDGTNADQFQPYVRVTPRGQVNVSFFDRRLDLREPPVHPGNFFIDNFMARSNNGGATWTETRLSHDSWDPSINPPISGSGEFIGDYQGLVADDCFAIAYMNDTHLANDPARDPDFDHGLPRSRFQELFAWRLPNVVRYGGAKSRDCRRHHHGHHFKARRVRRGLANAARAPIFRRSTRWWPSMWDRRGALDSMVVSERGPLEQKAGG
ncbi:MAG TPA: hypothetical protein VHJ39_16605 [Solirubrobacteraceae bacterium]|nr:hypothetical protein [Solirubrobacteraceae bacterium]